MSATTSRRPALARRLRAFREQEWPGVVLTQAQLAQALGGTKPLSISLISSWENTDRPVIPPQRRLTAYATLFATERSLENGTARILSLDELTDGERRRRDELLDELLRLRDGGATNTGERPADIWDFPDGENITIVCALLPERLRPGGSYADPDSPDFVSLYTYSDPDALIELFGHLRSVNPRNQVHFRTTEELAPDDYTAHLVLLGGVDWNTVTRDVIRRVEFPVEQVGRVGDAPTDEPGGFRVQRESGPEFFRSTFDSKGRLLEDVAHFYHGVSPFNRKRTVTVCNGMHSRGTLGTVRALTDTRFRDRNQEYLRTRFGGAEAFSIVSRVPVVLGIGTTPDWTVADNRLHEWPEGA